MTEAPSPPRGCVVVTGAAGLVGQNLIPRLKARGYGDAVAIDLAVSRGQRIVYAPWFWRPIMTAVRFAPRPLFYKTKL